MGKKHFFTEEEKLAILEFAQYCVEKQNKMFLGQSKSEFQNCEIQNTIVECFDLLLYKLGKLYECGKEERAKVIEWAVSSGDASNENIKRLEEYYINGVITDNK